MYCSSVSRLWSTTTAGVRFLRAPTRSRKRFFLGMSLASQLGLLAYFKYTNFAIDSVKAALQVFGISSGLHHLNIVLPVGISFYTFMSLSYTLDIYFGRFQPVDSLRTFALYLAFFPHLVAGPILRAARLLPQLRSAIRITPLNLRQGFSLILYGLVKKVVVADNLAPFVKETLTGNLTHDSLAIFVAIVAFAIQIYCDFSGYTDIAIGSARVMGLPSPATSRTRTSRPASLSSGNAGISASRAGCGTTFTSRWAATGKDERDSV